MCGLLTMAVRTAGLHQILFGVNAYLTGDKILNWLAEWVTLVTVDSL